MIYFIDKVPEGYIVGQERSEDKGQVSHLYKGNFADPGLPMCKRGWNRDNGTSYSIWRGNVGKRGICQICLRRANKGLDGVPSK